MKSRFRWSVMLCWGFLVLVRKQGCLWDFRVGFLISLVTRPYPAHGFSVWFTSGARLWAGHSTPWCPCSYKCDLSCFLKWSVALYWTDGGIVVLMWGWSLLITPHHHPPLQLLPSTHQVPGEQNQHCAPGAPCLSAFSLITFIISQFGLFLKLCPWDSGQWEPGTNSVLVLVTRCAS